MNDKYEGKVADDGMHVVFYVVLSIALIVAFAAGCFMGGIMW